VNSYLVVQVASIGRIGCAQKCHPERQQLCRKMFPFGGIIMNNHVVKTTSAGV